MARYVIVLLFFMFSAASCVNTGEIGKTYRGWKKGELDIHHIYTGRGEANFFIFPDGTSMLIDAGDWDPNHYPFMCELLPDSSRRAGEWIARYIMNVNPHKNEVDYLEISHFHEDHIGDASNEAVKTKGRNPDYLLTGIAQVGETIRFKKIIDRAWPEYDSICDPHINNYRSFLQWNITNNRSKAERFEVGSASQISLQYDKSRYGDLFSVRNLIGNGVMWTGKQNELICFYNSQNKDGWKNENTKSLGMRITYGDFRYYTAGDLSGRICDREGNDIDIEEKVAKVCGPVNVCKANHHAYKDAMTERFVKNISASAYIVPVWDYEHIQPEIMERMAFSKPYAGNPIIYTTAFPDSLQKAYAAHPWKKFVAKENGHVIVKVMDKGKKYLIYILSPSDESLKVKAIYGPFEAKE